MTIYVTSNHIVMEQGMKCIWLQWRSDGQAIPPSVIQSIDPWLCYLHQTSHLWTSERAWFLTHIIGNEMLTYLKLYAFWYNTASSYWDTPVVYIIAGLYIIHTILITFLSCMQSLMRITPLLEKNDVPRLSDETYLLYTHFFKRQMLRNREW